MHEKTALLVEPGNVQELSDAIIHLAESRELRETLGTTARQVAINAIPGNVTPGK